MSFTTHGESFFSKFRLLGSSTKLPLGDNIFQSMQPLQITSILAREFEPEVDYASTGMSLADIFCDLTEIARKFGTATDIEFRLLEIETCLSVLHNKHHKAFYYRNDKWFAETFKVSRTTCWYSPAYCFSMFHACRLFLFRLLLHSIYKRRISCLLSNLDDSDILRMLFSDSKFVHYYEFFVESAILLSKFHASLARLDLPIILIELCMNVFQCTGALLIMAAVIRPPKENYAYNDIINRIHENMKFIRSYRALYAHLPIIIAGFEKLQEKILPTESYQSIGGAFNHVHEYVDLGIASIMRKDVDSASEGSENMDEVIYPTYINSLNTANMSDIEILNNIFNKFSV